MSSLKLHTHGIEVQSSTSIQNCEMLMHCSVQMPCHLNARGMLSDAKYFFGSSMMRIEAVLYILLLEQKGDYPWNVDTIAIL
jgi:hypothetical protein